MIKTFAKGKTKIKNLIINNLFRKDKKCNIFIILKLVLLNWLHSSVTEMLPIAIKPLHGSLLYAYLTKEPSCLYIYICACVKVKISTLDSMRPNNNQIKFIFIIKTLLCEKCPWLFGPLHFVCISECLCSVCCRSNALYLIE